MTRFLFSTVLLIASSMLSAQELLVDVDEAWEGFSAPEIMSSGFTNSMSALPLEGKLEDGTRGWSSTYWPSNKGGIANRWNSPRKETFDYKSPTREQVATMSLEQLKLLSPAEKYDLLLGQYDYSFKKQVYSSTSRIAKDWAGICHGWAPAAMLHSEPVPKTLKNPEGISIPFGSGDIKGLLSYFYAFYTDDQDTDQVGLRCFFGSWLGGARGCNDDLNAGAFHIILANKLGLAGEGFLVDIDRYNEVWNQPAYGYKAQVLDAYLPVSKKAARSAVREMRVQTDFFYVDESDPTWNAVYGTPDQVISKLELSYRLEIDASGNIVGGAWESKDRPDFLWNKKKVSGFSGVFTKLPELLVD
jgi:hypothetical protein